MIKISICAFLLSVGFTGIVRRIARRTGFVSQPSGERWNARTVPLGGGIAIMFSILVGLLLIRERSSFELLFPFTVIGLVGLVDDLWGVSPTQKLAAQIFVALFIVLRGYVLPIPTVTLSFIITVVWIVGITNAINLLDNMDAVASGVSAICAFAMIFALPQTGGYREVAAIVGATCLGFLIHNFNPARIFMGDSGALALGFILGSLATKLQMQNTELPYFYSLPLPILVLSVPIFDTFFVIISRLLNRTPISNGGSDHTTHRLVALGLSERQTAFTVFLLTILGAGSAIIISHLEWVFFIVTALVIATLFIGLGFSLLKIPIQKAKRGKT